MNERSSSSSLKASRVRAFSMIFPCLICLTAAMSIFIPDAAGADQIPDERTAEFPQETTAVEESAISLNDVIPELELPEILGAAEAGQIPDEWALGSSQEKEGSKKTVYTLCSTVLGPELPGAVERDPKKMGYSLGMEDVTGLGNVRASNVKVGVDYKMSKNSSVGVEARQGMHDTQDAAAWGGPVDDETSAQAKYKLAF